MSAKTTTESMIRSRRRISGDQLSAILTLVPSLVLVGIFIYGFIVWTGFVSFTKWNSFMINFSFNGFRNYIAIFQSFRFQSDLRNMLFFTILFMLGCLIIGIFLAVLIDSRIKGESVFRAIFLYPMAVSAAATGVVWNWLLNPTSGVNLIFKALGFSHVPQWYLSQRIWPTLHIGSINGGFPIALIAVLIASIWQWSGFAMALYLAGLRAIPEEIREAAKIDGASAWRTFWSVLFPQLRTISATAVIMLMASSLKVFDLIYAMTGPGVGFSTDLPALDMFQTTFLGNQFAQGAAIATVLLVLVLFFVIPYLIRSIRQEVQ